MSTSSRPSCKRIAVSRAQIMRNSERRKLKCDGHRHFSPEMLEKNGLKESAVLRLSDDRHWLEYSRTQPTGLGREYWLSI